jgi:hypothetical protein
VSPLLPMLQNCLSLLFAASSPIRKRATTTPPRRSLALRRKRSSRHIASGLSAQDSDAAVSAGAMEMAVKRRNGAWPTRRYGCLTRCSGQDPARQPPLPGGGRGGHNGQRGAWRARGAHPRSVGTHSAPPPCPSPMPSTSCRPPPRHLHCATSIASRPQIRPHTLRLCRLRHATLHCIVSATPHMPCRTHRSDRTPSGHATSTAPYPHGWAYVASTLRTMMSWSPRAAEGPVLGKPLPRQRASCIPEPGGWRRHRGRRGRGFERNLMSPRGG